MSKKSDKKWQKVAEDTNEEIAAETFDEEESVSGGDALDHPSYKALEDKLTEAEQKAHENWDQVARAVAELENVRRRSARDVENAHKYALEKFVREIVPVVDSLEQAMQIEVKGNQVAENVRHGIELTLKLLLDALTKFSISQIDPQGEKFDPKLHEAMSMQENQDVEPGTILMVFQKGYLLHERVIRPARVIVAQRLEN